MAATNKAGALRLQFSTEVARQIRQHARSSRKTEVCGVLIGTEDAGVTKVEACIAGASAAQGGAHVTFTQDTWEHIYKVKDRDYPEDRIVGWYHSHPGFGIFLSDHDTFIHKNFFSSPSQVAWVYDPHSDEEGCFGWRNQRLERIGEFEFVDSRGGERADATGKSEPVTDDIDDEKDSAGSTRSPGKTKESDDDLSKLTKIVTNVFSYLAIFALGGLFVWYLVPRVLVLGVPFDPNTGRPPREFMDSEHEAIGFWLNGPNAGQRADIPLGPLPGAPPSTSPATPEAAPGQSGGSDPKAAKKDDGQR